MENIISVNNKASDAPVLSLSDQETDLLLKLIRTCAFKGEMTGSQLELVEYLDDLRYKSFDIGDLPWNACCIEDDKKYLQDLLAKVQAHDGAENLSSKIGTLCQLIASFDPKCYDKTFDSDEMKAKLRFKKDLGWKACFDSERGIYTAERSGRGFYQLCEIDKETYDKLGSAEDPEELIRSGRVLFEADDDYYTMPYCIVKDDNYNELAPWSRAKARYDRTYGND